MFGIKKDKDKPTTLEEVRKAYEDLSDEDKKSFHQSIADRIHESVGEQEAKNGQKDEQSAADREHEALGEEHADGEGDTEELGETDEGKAGEKAETAAEEKHEEAEKNAYESAFGNKHIIPAWNIHRGNHSIVMIYIMSIATVELAQTKCNML